MAPEVKEAAEKAKDAVADRAGGGGGGSLATKLVVPAAAAVGTLASGWVARKVKDQVLPRLEQAGKDDATELGRRAVSGVKDAVSEQGGLAGKAAGKLLGGGGDDENQPAHGWGRGRRLPVQCSVDVAVPAKVAYEQWTQFEDFPQFMHRVEQIEQRDDETLVWQENIWGISRSWRAEIVEQVKNQRIAWRSESRGGHSGVVTFHPLSDRLTRIELNVDFQPQGLFEKLSSGLRFHRRALRTDLQRFKAFVEMRNEPTGAWRGEIHEEERNPARQAPLGGGGDDGGDRDESEDGGGPEEREQRRERRRRRQRSATGSR